MDSKPTEVITDTNQILQVKNLHVYFYTSQGVAKVINGFDLVIGHGEMSALVGESGSGKTVAAWSILGLPRLPGKIIEGEINWHGENILNMSPDRLRRLRGKEIGLILSNPTSCLHPFIKVGEQIKAVCNAHNQNSKDEALKSTLEILSAMRLPDTKRIFNSYVYELSGGMAQRIMIAMTLVNSPELILADDSTNGLDVTIQRQVLDLTNELIQQRNTSALMITHDLGVVAQYCRNVTIIYAGQTVEIASVKQLFQNPLHPYTKGLLGSIRSVSLRVQGKSLPGIAPNPKELPSGCYLQPRCPARLPKCSQGRPILQQAEPGHFVRCFRYSDAELPVDEKVLSSSIDLNKEIV